MLPDQGQRVQARHRRRRGHRDPGHRCTGILRSRRRPALRTAPRQQRDHPDQQARGHAVGCPVPGGAQRKRRSLRRTAHQHAGLRIHAGRRHSGIRGPRVPQVEHARQRNRKGLRRRRPLQPRGCRRRSDRAVRTVDPRRLLRQRHRRGCHARHAPHREAGQHPEPPLNDLLSVRLHRYHSAQRKGRKRHRIPRIAVRFGHHQAQQLLDARQRRRHIQPQQRQWIQQGTQQGGVLQVRRNRGLHVA